MIAANVDIVFGLLVGIPSAIPVALFIWVMEQKHPTPNMH